MILLKQFGFLCLFIHCRSSNVQFLTSIYLIFNFGILSLTLQANDMVVMPITEDFEANSIGDMSFSEGGIDFNATGGLEVNEFAGFTKYMEEYLSSNNGGSVGSFAITTSNTAFRVVSLDIWPSTTAASNYMTGLIKFIGTPSAGGSPIEVEFTPTGGSNSTYGAIDFTGSLLDGIDLLSLEFVLPSGLGYLAIDNFEFLASSTLNASFSISSESVVEGDAGTTTMTFTVAKTAGPSAESITVQTANVSALAGSDYQAAGPTILMFGAGASTQNFDVLINGDMEFEGQSEIFHALLSNPSGTGVIVTGTGVGTIIDDELICEDFEDNNIGDMSFSENGIGFSAAPFSVATFTNFTQYMEVLAIGNVGSFTRTSNDPAISAISIDVWMAVSSSSTSASAGMLTVTGTPSDGSPSIVELINVPQPMGGTPGFPYSRVSFIGTQLATTALTSISFTLANGLGYIAIDNFKFIEVAGNSTNVSIANASTIEGDIGLNQLNFIVTRSDSLSAFDVDFNTINGSAVAGQEYNALSTTLNFQANGDFTKIVTVGVFGDVLVEPDKSMSATLSNATNGANISSGNATGTIIDDDLICEEFELDGPHGSITFEEFGASFGLTDDLIVGFFNNGGAGSSDFFIETDTNFLPHSGNVGSILLNNGCSFSVKQLDLYVSTDADIDNANIGATKFIGNLVGGGIASVDLLTTTTNNWTTNLSFAGTALENQSLLSLEIELPDSVQYVAIDNFKFVHEHLSPGVGTVNVPTCGGAADGSFEIIGLDANSMYSIQYDQGGATTGPQNVMTDGAGSFTISNLSAGVYTNMIISSTDPISCMTPAFDIFLVQPNLPDSDGDGTPDCADGCPDDPNKTGPGTCGCNNPEPGTPCDDGNVCTINDVIGPDCSCSGTSLSDTTYVNTFTCDSNQAGAVIDTFPNLSGCDSIVITTINLDSFPTPANAGPDQNVCGTTAILAGNIPTVGTGLWVTLSGSPSITNPSDPNTTVSNLTLGNNVYEWTISNGVCPPSKDTVTINRDNTPPVAVCKNLTVYLDVGGNANITGADVDNGSNDFCGIASLTVTPSSFNCSNTGANSVVLTVTDSSGFSHTCNATVNVIDTTAPIALCQDITVQLDATGNASITASNIDNGSNDACGIASLGLDNSSFDCSDVGPNSVTLTVTDNNGNLTTCTANVTVEDNIAPIALCKDITVYLDSANGHASIVGADVDNGSNDACGITSLNVSPNGFTCSNESMSPITVTLRVMDNNGNVSTCTAKVTVRDTLVPTAICKDITVYLDSANGQASITTGDVDNGSNDNCNIELSINQDMFDCSNIGTNTVILTAEERWGSNLDTCHATVTVIDTTPPVATCQDLTIQLDASGSTSITPEDINNGSSDACGIASLALDTSNFDCSDVGPNIVTLTVTDVNGNPSTCAATVTVEDNISPIALCQNITVYLDATGNASITETDVDNGSSDACGIASLAVSPSTFICANVGPNLVTLTVTDVNGNIDTCMANVMVLDTTSPVTVCQNITIYLDGSGNRSITEVDIDGGSIDNCTIANLSAGPTSFTCADTGANNVVLNVTDVNGNSAMCTAVVTVLDSTPPAALCQDITVHLDAAGNSSITASDLDGGSTDNCQVDSLHASQTDFTCVDLGSNPVTLQVIDGYGNESTCVSTVTVTDTSSPIALCQNIMVNLTIDGTVTITPEMIDNGSTDNCSIQSLILDKTLFTCSDTGANAVILMVTDQSGNTGTCEAIVTVGDVVVSPQNIIGMAPVCPGLNGVPYSVNPDPSVLSYQWTYSGTGATITGNGQPNITIDFAENAAPGILQLNFITACGPSEIASSFPITIASIFSCALATNCLTDNLFVINTMIGFAGNVNLFKANVSVSSAATIEKDQTVIFMAGQEINLLPTFEVEKGALFLAEIEGCFDNLKTEKIRKNE